MNDSTNKSIEVETELEFLLSLRENSYKGYKPFLPYRSSKDLDNKFLLGVCVAGVCALLDVVGSLRTEGLQTTLDRLAVRPDLFNIFCIFQSRFDGLL